MPQQEHEFLSGNLQQLKIREAVGKVLVPVLVLVLVLISYTSHLVARSAHPRVSLGVINKSNRGGKGQTVLRSLR